MFYRFINDEQPRSEPREGPGPTLRATGRSRGSAEQLTTVDGHVGDLVRLARPPTAAGPPELQLLATGDVPLHLVVAGVARRVASRRAVRVHADAHDVGVVRERVLGPGEPVLGPALGPDVDVVAGTAGRTQIDATRAVGTGSVAFRHDGLRVINHWILQSNRALVSLEQLPEWKC